jgi:hypothetical protein
VLLTVERQENFFQPGRVEADPEDTVPPLQDHAPRDAGHGPDGCARVSDDGDVVRRRTLGTRDDVKLDTCALIKGLETFCLDGGIVDEDVAAVILGDETKSFVAVEPLHCSLNHFSLLLFTPFPQGNTVIEKPGRSWTRLAGSLPQAQKKPRIPSGDRAPYLLNCLVCTQDCRVTCIKVQGFMEESNLFFRCSPAAIGFPGKGSPFDLKACEGYDGT